MRAGAYAHSRYRGDVVTTRRNRNRLPPQRAKDIILIGQLAGALKWSAARVRGVDGILKPLRLSDGTRAYNVERAMAWVRSWDEFMAWSDARAAHDSDR